MGGVSSSGVWAPSLGFFRKPQLVRGLQRMWWVCKDSRVAFGIVWMMHGVERYSALLYRRPPYGRSEMRILLLLAFLFSTVPKKVALPYLILMWCSSPEAQVRLWHTVRTHSSRDSEPRPIFLLSDL